MENICGKDGGIIPIAKGIIDSNRGRNRHTLEEKTPIRVYFIRNKTNSHTRKNTTITLTYNK